MAGGKEKSKQHQRKNCSILWKNECQLSYLTHHILPALLQLELGDVLPRQHTQSLQQGFRMFDTSMKGYLTNDAVVHAPETRTSSPVRILRERDTFRACAYKRLISLW